MRARVQRTALLFLGYFVMAAICTSVLMPATMALAAPAQGTNVSTAAPGSQVTPSTVASESALSAAAQADAQNPSATVKPDDTGSFVYNISVSLGGFIVALGGSIFDTAVYQFVLQMGCWYVHNDQCSGSLGAVVNSLWTTIRDIFNILFIYGLVYIGIRTILVADDTSAQRALGMLILAALLINFSLYITKAIVDVSNYAAVSVYDIATSGLQDSFQLSTNPVDSSGKYTDQGSTYQPGQTAGRAGLSEAYMSLLQISGWFSSGIYGGWQAVMFSIVVLIFCIITGLTLAYGGLLLLARFIALTIFMIFSPAMFIGWIVPQFDRYMKQWWHGFLQYAFFAPAYIFLLYLGLYALSQMQSTFSTYTYSSSFQSGAQWNPNTFDIFVYFAMGIGFLLFATRVGNSMSKAGSSAILDGAIHNTVTRLKNRSLGIMGRNTIGRAAGGLMKYNERLDESRTGRFVKGALTAGALGLVDEHDRREALEGLHKSRFSGKRSREEAKNIGHEREGQVSAGIDRGKLRDPNTTERERQKIVSGLSDKDIATMASRPKGRETLLQNIDAMNAGQVKALQKIDSPDVPGEFKDAVKTKYRGVLKDKLEKGAKDDYGMGLAGATTNQLQSLNIEKDIITNEKDGNHYAAYLQTGQMEMFKKELTDADYSLLNDARNKQFEDLAGTPAGAKKLIESRKSLRDIAKLPPAILMKPHVLDALKAEQNGQSKLSAQLMAAIARESDVDLRQFGHAVADLYGGFRNLPPDIRKYMLGSGGNRFLYAGYGNATSRTTAPPPAPAAPTAPQATGEMRPPIVPGAIDRNNRTLPPSL